MRDEVEKRARWVGEGGRVGRAKREKREGAEPGGGPIDSLGGGGEVTDLAPFSLSFCILLFLVLKSVSGDTHHVAPRVIRILRRIRTSRRSSLVARLHWASLN